MGELGELRIRVDQAVDRLSAAADTRHRQSQGLMTLLTDLETKYEARNEELEHSRQRIEALSRENADLSALVEKLVRIVDTTVSADDENPLFRATAVATDLVADWSAPGDVAVPVDHMEETAANDDADDEIESSADEDGDLDARIASALGHDSAADTFAALEPSLGFEDVGEEELAGEQLDGDPEALAALLDTPLTPDVDHVAEELVAQQADEPFAVSDVDLDEVAVADIADLDTAFIGSPDIDTTDFASTPLDVSDGIDPIQELLSADLDIPEIVLDDEPISRIDPEEDTESSIRAMMARLEEAATRAKTRDEDRPEVEADEAPAVAAGGAG